MICCSLGMWCQLIAAQDLEGAYHSPGLSRHWCIVLHKSYHSESGHRPFLLPSFSSDSPSCFPPPFFSPLIPLFLPLPIWGGCDGSEARSCPAVKVPVWGQPRTGLRAQTHSAVEIQADLCVEGATSAVGSLQSSCWLPAGAGGTVSDLQAFCARVLICRSPAFEFFRC